MAIGIKKVGQISTSHIPTSIRRNASQYESTEKRLYTKADDGSEMFLILVPYCDNFSWTFHSWKQPTLWEEVDMQATDVEALFIQNIALLQHKYGLDSIEAPESCRNRVDEMPLYYDDDEDEECSDEELDAWLDKDGEE
jgi:hypothetical protein